MKKYFHVTRVDTFGKILDEGLKVNELGELFLFDDKRFAGQIAINQCGLTEYALLCISGLDEPRLKPDNVGELSAHSQWVYDRPIPAKDVQLVNVYRILLPS